MVQMTIIFDGFLKVKIFLKMEFSTHFLLIKVMVIEIHYAELWIWYFIEIRSSLYNAFLKKCNLLQVFGKSD